MLSAFFRPLSLICILGVFGTGCSEAPPPTRAQKPARLHLVEVINVQPSIDSITRERTGTLKAIREIQVFNQEEGRIIEMPFFEGDTIKKGDLIVRLDDHLLKAQLQRTQAIRRKAEKDLQRVRSLNQRKLTSVTDLNDAETALEIAKADEQLLQTRLDYTRIYAPISGIISERLSEANNIAERYTHLLTLSDQSALVTEVPISELLLNQLSIGDEVDIRIDALTQLSTLKGKITRIHPNLNPITRTGTVEISLHPVPSGARPGQLARVTLNTQTAERLLVPFSSLRRDAQGDYLFILNGQQKAQKSYIRTGERISESIEVLEGLNAGDQVITRGFTNLKSGTDVTLVKSAHGTLP